jgi:hypothetical protein
MQVWLSKVRTRSVIQRHAGHDRGQCGAVDHARRAHHDRVGQVELAYEFGQRFPCAHSRVTS